MQNINARNDSFWTKISNSKLKKNLFREVIGENEKILSELWKDLVEKNDHEIITDTFKHLSNNQKDILYDYYNKQIEFITNQIEGFKKNLDNDINVIEVERLSIKLSELDNIAGKFKSFISLDINKSNLPTEESAKIAGDNQEF